LETLQTEYTAKETEQKTAIQAGLPISAINAQLLAIAAEIDLKEAEIEAKQAEVDLIIDAVGVINESLSFENNFTDDQYKELSNFMFENTYRNETIIVTDLSTPVQIQDASQELYNQAMNVLSRSSLPRYEFKMDTANFIALKGFEYFTEQTDPGVSVTVSINDDYFIIPVLLEIDMSYDNPDDFSLVFSNRLRLDNGAYQYSDLMGQVVSTGTTVAGSIQQWNSWDSNYKDEVSNFITSALDASRNAVINATNQEIVIGTNGLRGRKLEDNGIYNDKQVWLINNELVFLVFDILDGTINQSQKTIDLSSLPLEEVEGLERIIRIDDQLYSILSHSTWLAG
jgi:hypothetical protein